MVVIKNTRSFFVVSGMILLIMFIALPAAAEMTAGCHCFKHRSYDPESRFIADDYILATSFNSLTANYFSISKKEIVMLKMKSSVQQNDLLLALKLGRDFGVDYKPLLHLLKQGLSWQNIISHSQAFPEDSRNELLVMIRAGAPVNDLGKKVTSFMIADFYAVPENEVEQVRSKGFNEKELALLYLLVRTKPVKAKDLLVKIKEKGQSWSEVAHNLDITPAMAGKLIASYGK